VFPSTDKAETSRSWGRNMSTAWQYTSANILVLLGSAAFFVGGWAPFVVIVLIVVFGSFADEITGDDWDSLSGSARAFFNINLYLSLPLICLLTVY
jgi:hypothetical protein